jgi:hypothetical protein
MLRFGTRVQYQRCRGMRTPSPSRDVLLEIAGQAAVGGLCFITLIVLAVSTDYAGIRELMRGDVSLSIVPAVGALTTFAPLLICIAIGNLRRGDQREAWGAHDSDDFPLR